MEQIVFVRLLVVLSLAGISFAQDFMPKGEDDVVAKLVGSVLEATSQPDWSVILLTDGHVSPYTLFKMVDEIPAPWGVGVFEVDADGQDANVTQEQFSQVVGLARRLRQSSWCVSVVLVSEDPSFLAAFAQWSLKGRLLVWSTRLLVLTRLPLQHLHHLLATHWTFSMMNVMFINIESKTRCRIYSYMPYGPKGEVMSIASWTPASDLVTLPHHELFPEKFENFHGATLPVTGLHWPPVFIEYEEENSDGIFVKKYKGPDGLMLTSLAKALNFTFRLLPVSNWVQAADRVVERKALILTAYHVVLYTRLQRYDYTYTYTYISLGFGLAKPKLQPQWQSLYYPLADKVWASTLAALLLMPAIMFMINIKNKDYLGSKTSGYSGGSRGFGSITMEIFGILVGQNLSKWFPKVSSSRVLLATWLVFAFILATSYRGNLIASLTLPRYPSRPETVEQVVNHVDRVTMPPFGDDWKRWLQQSGSRTLTRLANIMYIGPSVPDGLQQANEKKQAHISVRIEINHWIVKRFMQADGHKPLYFARETLVPGASAWPIPHDAPYKLQLDKVMMAVTEAGLYQKWQQDTLDEIRVANLRKLRERQQSGHEIQSSQSSNNRALTIIHMQGPLLLLLLGLGVSGLISTSEILKWRCSI